MTSPEAESILTPEMLDNHVGVMGKTGSGKSNVAKVAVEAMLNRGDRVCIIDPTGSWYGLRLMPDFSPSPYEIVIFGGEHQDVAISGAHGNAVAEIIATSSTPAIIDTQQMSVGARTAFFADFAQRLFEKNRGTLHLVIDEAHLFAPKGRVQDVKSGEMLSAANNLASLGRGRGIRGMFLSQRPAKLHNDTLTQIETLEALRLVAHWDVDAIKDWIKTTASLEEASEMVSSLPKLRTGSGWLWAPTLDIFRQFDAPLVRTLDTGKPSDQAVQLWPIDVGAVQNQLTVAEEEVAANDPKALKARVKALEAQLAGKAPVIQEKIVYRLDDDTATVILGELDHLWRFVSDAHTATKGDVERIREAVTRARGLYEATRADPVVQEEPRGRSTDTEKPAKLRVARSGAAAPAAAAPTGPQDDLGRMILRSLVDAPNGRSLQQIALMTLYSPNGGFFRKTMVQLREGGKIELVDGKMRLVGDQDGLEPIPTGRPLREAWVNSGRLPGASVAIVQKLAEIGHDVSMGDLAAAMNYSVNGGWFRTGIKKARAMGAINGLLELGLAEELTG